MFAYCNNNPVNFRDPSGRFIDLDLLPNQQAGKNYAEDLLEQVDAINSGEVIYHANEGEDSGGQIENSHRIRSKFLMYYFVNENRGNEVSGFTAGIVFEWKLHNLAYDRASLNGNIESMKQAEDVDFGNTIWADDHANWESYLMKILYIILYPFHAELDYKTQTHQWEVEP